MHEDLVAVIADDYRRRIDRKAPWRDALLRISGHPYLTQRVCAALVAAGSRDVAGVVDATCSSSQQAVEQRRRVVRSILLLAGFVPASPVLLVATVWLWVLQSHATSDLAAQGRTITSLTQHIEELKAQQKNVVDSLQAQLAVAQELADSRKQVNDSLQASLVTFSDRARAGRRGLQHQRGGRPQGRPEPARRDPETAHRAADRRRHVLAAVPENAGSRRCAERVALGTTAIRRAGSGRAIAQAMAPATTASGAERRDVRGGADRSRIGPRRARLADRRSARRRTAPLLRPRGPLLAS